MRLFSVARKYPLLCIILLGAALRLVVFCVFLSSGEGLLRVPDTSSYMEPASALVATGQLNESLDPGAGPETFRTPGYPFFLAVFLRLFGENDVWISLSQIVLGLLTIWGTWHLGARMVHPYAGLFAALLIAVNPTLVYRDGLLATETLFTFLLLMGLICAWRATESKSWWFFAAASGLVVGLSVLVRPFGLLVWALLVLFYAVAECKRPLRAVALVALMGLFYALPVGGWMMRNKVRVGEAALTTIAGYNLLEARAGTIRMLQTGQDWHSAKDDLYAELDAMGEGKNWSSLEREAAAKNLAMDILTEHPGLMVRGSVSSFFHVYVGANLAFYQRLFHGRIKMEPIRGLERVPYVGWMLSHFAALGLVYLLVGIGVVSMVRRREWRSSLLLVGISLYPAALLLCAATAHSRYRMPHDPYLAILAGAGLAAFAFRFRRTRAGHLPPLAEKPRVVVCLPVVNEREKIVRLLDEFPYDLVDKVVVADDGSDDGTPEILSQYPIEVIRHDKNMGIGTAIRDVIHFGRRNNFDIVVVMAGNGKDSPKEIPAVVRPILDKQVAYVQGSRFLNPGFHENTPLFRWITIRLYTAIFNLFSPYRCTDLTNGFRAYRLDLFDDPDIAIDQEWLDRYELEYYIHFKAFMLGYPVAEAPVHKRYPSDRKVAYTKISPFVDWWKMIRPMVFLFLRVKH